MVVLTLLMLKSLETGPIARRLVSSRATYMILQEKGRPEAMENLCAGFPDRTIKQRESRRSEPHLVSRTR
jgi:hypothetical protein